MLRNALRSLLILSACSTVVQAEWPVDDSVPLEEISTEFDLADGPAWDGRSALYVPDVKGETLYLYRPNQQEKVPFLKNAGRISASFYNHGQLYLSDNARARIDILRGKERTSLAILEEGEKPQKRPNDLVVDNQQGVYVTLTKQNQVVYITANGTISTAVAEVTTPNGITISPDESTLYVAAYVPKEIWAYDITAPGQTTNGRLLCKMDDGPEKGADGMTVDRAGNIYCAGPQHVWIWKPDGTLLDKIETPTRPINCAFGDSSMQSLYITCFGGLYRQQMLISGRAPQPSNPVSDNIKFTPDQVYADVDGRKLLFDLFTPQAGPNAKPCLVVVHGGGWLKGDKTKFRELSLRLAQRGYVVATIEYRLGGEALFPAAIHDCNTAVRYLRAHAEQLGIDPQRIGAIGGSAGGHLVGLMATGANDKQLIGTGAYQDRSSRLQAAIVMAGPMEMTTGSVAERSLSGKGFSNSNVWLGGTIDEKPELYALADAHLHISKNSPPILFMVGEHDKPERNAPSRERLKSVGVWTDVKVYKDGKHGCWNSDPWRAEMVEDMDQFFKEHLTSTD